MSSINPISQATTFKSATGKNSVNQKKHTEAKQSVGSTKRCLNKERQNLNNVLNHLSDAEFDITTLEKVKTITENIKKLERIYANLKKADLNSS